MPDQKLQLYAFPKGLITRGVSPLNFPTDALADGANILLANGGFETRKGYSVVAKLESVADTVTYDQIAAMWQVRFAGTGKNYLIGQTTGTLGSTSYSPYVLVILSDDLPPSTPPATMTVLKQLGERVSGNWEAPGVLSMATLNDRAIFTDGVKHQPLVFLGGQSATDTDWATPKQVLVSREGDVEYDITSGVCDGDTSTTANVANISANGSLHVVFDTPRATAIGITMGQVNTLDVGSAPAVSRTRTFDDADMFTQRDLKATIDHWVEDTPGAGTGHFENAANTALTLGAGNDCPLVEAGLTVVFADGSAVGLKSITGNGDGADEVELDSTVTSQDVTAIYGIIQDTNGISLSYANRVWTTLRNLSWSSGRQFIWPASTGYLRVREVLLGSLLGTSARVRITLAAELTYLNLDMNLYPTAYFGLRSGTSDDFASTPTAGTFSPTPLGSGESAVCEFNYATVPGSNYLFAFSVGPDTYEYNGTQYTRITIPQYNQITSGWYYSDDDEDPDGGALTVAYVPAGALSSTFIKKVETMGTPVAPTGRMIFTTSAAGALDCFGAEAFYGLTITESKPGSSVLYYALSWDLGATYSVWTDTAWQQIVRDNSPWEYWDGAAWQAASEDNLEAALADAFAVAANQKTAADIAAITESEWAEDGAWVQYQTSMIYMAVAAVADGTNIPYCTSVTVRIADAGSVVVQTYVNGQIVSQSWTDGTAVANVPLAQSGILEYAGSGDYSEATYATINGIPGYHRWIQLPGTSSACSITKLTYKAPVQDLCNIGVIGADKALQVLWEDVSAGTLTDISAQMADNDLTELSEAVIPLGTGDKIYVCGLYPYNEIDVTPLVSNGNAAALSCQYHDGAQWTSTSLVDGTVAVTGKTLSGAGKLSFPLPSDWQPTMPFDSNQQYGYWTCFTASAALSSTTSLVEVRVYTVPPILKKHRYAATFAERLALVDRPDNRNQIDISRALEEYGFVGDDAAADNTGGTAGSTGAIQAVVEAWNSLVIFKSDGSTYLLTGSSPQNFTLTRIETSERLIPINSRVIVKAPMSGDDGDRPGLYFLNQHGAFATAGIQADTNYGTMRAMELSDRLNYWDTKTTGERIDVNYLHLASGAYWPVENWIVWAVPMILEGESSQTTCNRLLIWDLNLKAWLPPMWFTAPSGSGDLQIGALCTVYHYNPNAPNGVGEMALYAGVQGSDGVYVVRLFDPTADTDNGADVEWSAETGWISFGRDVKQVRDLVVYGSSDNNVDVAVYRDGVTTAIATQAKTIMKLYDLDGREFNVEPRGLNVRADFLKARFSGIGPAKVYAEYGVNDLRDVRG